MRFFVPLMKVEDGDDDTLIVSGVASTETPDRSGEILTAKAVQDALPDFFAHGTGALREMHQLSAAGTVDEAHINEDNQTLISTTVVDPEAIKKVRKGVYKGFSVGGKVLERDKKDRKIITKIALNEISLVDRPANPEAVFDLYKADGSIKTEKADPMTDKTLAKTEADAAAALAKAAETPAETVDAAAAPTAAEVDAVAKADASVVAVEPEPAIVADPLAKTEAALSKMEATLAAVAGSDDLAKGLYAVGRFAEVLESICYLATSGQYEADAEGDNSPVPAALRSWLKDGAKIFKDMAKEEIDELVASVAIKKADASDALAKADAPVAEELAKTVAERDDLAKALADKTDILAKMAERIDPLAKAFDDMAARLAAVESQPMPAKTGGTLAKTDHLTAVGKAEDASGAVSSAPQLSNDQLKKALADMSEDSRAFLLTKAALSQPFAITR